MAVLEEFLQEKYVENYDRLSEFTNKIEGLSTIYSEYFYIPANENIGDMRYVVDSEGHALYLIKKSALPKEIQNELTGGNAGDGTYPDYQSLNDVYGVNSDLKVYYCKSGIDSIYGLVKDNLDRDDLRRVVLDKNSDIGKLIKTREDGTVTASDIQTVKNLTVDNTVSSLEDLYALTSLQNLTIEGANLNNLEGIQNATSINTVYFKNCYITDYSALSKLGNRLTHLSFYNIDDEELRKFCDGVKEANFGNLTHFAVVGVENGIWDKGEAVAGNSAKSERTITNLLPISSVGLNVFKNVTYLSLQNENINGFTGEDRERKYALENLDNFSSVILLRIERNNLTTLKGLEKMSQLKYLHASYNQLGKDEIYGPLNGETEEAMGKNNDLDALSSLSGKTNLSHLYLQGNKDLKWVGYLSGCTGLISLRFGNDPNKDCISMVDSEVSKLRIVLKNCGVNKSYPSKYWLSLLDENDDDLEVILSDQTVTLSQFKELGTYENIKKLDLLNIKIKNSDSNDNLIDDDEESINSLVNDVLKNMKNLKYLRLSASNNTSLKNLSNITFLKGADESNPSDDIDLIELGALGTKISTRKLGVNGEYVNYEEGLKLLELNRIVDDKTKFSYCPSLTNLLINESHIKLNDINERTKDLLAKYASSYFYGNRYGGLYSDSIDVVNSIAQCTGLSEINLKTLNFSGSENINLDLSSNLNLTVFSLTWGGCNGNFVLPSSCEEVNVDGVIGNLDLSKLSGLNLNVNNLAKDSVMKMLSTVREGVEISAFEGREPTLMGDNFSFFNDFFLKYSKRLNISSFSWGNSGTVYSATSLSGIEYINGLEEITLTSFPYLKDISSLNFQKETLTKIDMNNTSIAHCQVFEELKNLTYVSLENCSISDYYDLDDGRRIYNIKLICEAVETGCKKAGVSGTVKLKGNNKIQDWSYYTNRESLWTKESNYGATT